MSDIETLPYPIASLYREMLEESDPGFRLRALIRAFAGLLKFMSLLAISDYLDANPSDPAVDELLSGPNLSRPSLGHWNAFLREILAYHERRHGKPRVEGLGPFYAQRGAGAQLPGRQAIDALIRLRNEYVHPDIWPSEAMARRLCETHLPLLDGLYAGASFLAAYRFVYQAGASRRLCTGSRLAGFVELEPLPGRPDGFDLERDGEAPLPFLAFLVFGNTDTPDAPDDAPTLQQPDIMLYESRVSRRIKYLRGNSLSYRREESFAHTGAALARLKQRLGDNEEAARRVLREANVARPDWRRMQEDSARSSLQMVGVHRLEKKYAPRFYLNRKDLESRFEQFVAGTARVCLFVGDSGCGKTNLFCHLTETSLRRGHAVLHLYARNYDGSPMLGVVAAPLVSAPHELLPFLEALNESAAVREGARLVLFFDAINEYPNPAALYREIVDLEHRMHDAGVGFHKFVVSMRTATWRTIENSFDFTRERVFFSRGASDEQVERPRILIGPFTEAETIEAYRRYALQPDDSVEARRLKQQDFNIRLATPYESLPAGIRLLVANPIFLRYLVTTFDKVSRELTEADILLSFYDLHIGRRHRYFLAYFLEVLWGRRSDFLNEEELHATPAAGASDEHRHALARVRDYYYEDPVDDQATRFVCRNVDLYTKVRCENRDIERTIEEAPDLRCEACGLPLTEWRVPLRSTFFFMQDEGIISAYRSDSGAPVLRFTYDRFFEIMMARHLLRVLARDHIEGAQRTDRILGWIAEVAGLPIYGDVMVQLIAMLAGHRVVSDDDGASQASGLTEPKGVLYRLESRPLDHDCEDLMIRLARSGQPRSASIVRQALTRAGRDPVLAPGIHDFVTRLGKRSSSGGLSDAQRLELVRLSLTVAAELGHWQPFLEVAGHREAAARTLAVNQAYFLWKNHVESGLELLRRTEKQLFGPLLNPRLRLVEFFIGLAVLLLFRHPREERTTQQILALLARAAKRSGPWLFVLVKLLPLILRQVLREIPSDYNPVNLVELELGKRDIAAKPELRAALLAYLDLFEEATIDPERQRALVLRIRQLSPNNNIGYLIHQLAQAFRASQDLDAAVLTECEIGEAAMAGGGMWAQAPLYTALWLSSRTPQLDPALADRLIALWQLSCSTRNFAYAALAPGSAYHNWSIYYCALTLVKRSGSLHSEEVVALLQHLVATQDSTGLYAFFRGIDIVGAELSSMYPDALRLIRVSVPALLTACPDLPDASMQMLARTLQRMRVLYNDEVEAMLDGVHHAGARARLRGLMGQMPLVENIGVLAGVGGQDFYLFAMGQPYWRAQMAAFMRSLIMSRSIGQWLARALAALQLELQAAQQVPTTRRKEGS